MPVRTAAGAAGSSSSNFYLQLLPATFYLQPRQLVEARLLKVRVRVEVRVRVKGEGEAEAEAEAEAEGKGQGQGQGQTAGESSPRAGALRVIRR